MRKGDETKREILRAAEQLFCQKGYEAASMQEIVRAAGVSKGGIYHHFASKEEIMTLLSHQHAPGIGGTCRSPIGGCAG